MSAPARPVLRYHGGKWMLAPWIISHFPRHRVYTEPYCGAASVLLQKPRAYAEVIADLDEQVVNVFRVLRDPDLALQLARAIRLTPFARAEFVEAHRPAFDPVERARRTIIRSFMGFGSNALHIRSAFRANSNKSGTTPAMDWTAWPDEIAAFAERLRGVVIESRPALEIIRQHDGAETLHYVDPPYVHDTRGEHIGYAHEMTDADHREMADVLHRCRGMVVLSGYRCPLYYELFGDWVSIDRETHADGARDRIETLWLNPLAAEHQAQQDMFSPSAS